MYCIINAAWLAHSGFNCYGSTVRATFVCNCINTQGAVRWWCCCWWGTKQQLAFHSGACKLSDHPGGLQAKDTLVCVRCTKLSRRNGRWLPAKIPATRLPGSTGSWIFPTPGLFCTRFPCLAQRSATLTLCVEYFHGINGCREPWLFSDREKIAAACG